MSLPTIPDRIRKRILDDATDDYISGRIDDEEFESRVEDALRGRVRYKEAIKFTDMLVARNEAIFLGEEISVDDPIVAENIPDPFSV